MKLNREAYNKIADEWAESREKHSFVSNLVIEFASKVKPGGKILDIGCGTGFPIAKYLSEKGFEVTGIDISEKLLQKAIDRNLPNTTLYLCDFFDFEPKDKYDGIIAFDSFFHFPKEKQKLIYGRVSDWMNNDAYLLFTHVNKDGEGKGEMFDEMFYYSSLNKDEVLLLLSDKGFEVVWLKEMYTEKDMDRDLVILASKTNHKHH
jgi:cyclopropane fatty-acyl-phospholipid synthase-like methyltransferase